MWGELGPTLACLDPFEFLHTRSFLPNAPTFSRTHTGMIRNSKRFGPERIVDSRCQRMLRIRPMTRARWSLEPYRSPWSCCSRGLVVLCVVVRYGTPFQSSGAGRSLRRAPQGRHHPEDRQRSTAQIPSSSGIQTHPPGIDSITTLVSRLSYSTHRPLRRSDHGRTPTGVQTGYRRQGQAGDSRPGPVHRPSRCERNHHNS